ncbi:conserved unknown protein [Ectocarpus siliculosus]|uniref:Uncharacterized protein n=1 Tax=Ectocarpus siliculosus TaxID=2880 RepID=D7FMX8_ECTSI|nr:conserved unknown protein [Ectocarpus siliculosus]|eukprot:CBJ30042.1 conserved unknown protein [Ectocarpus siliculosus]
MFRGLEWLCTTDAPVLWPERIVYVGLRDVGVYEGKILHLLKQAQGHFASTTQDVDHLSIGKVMNLPCRGSSLRETWMKTAPRCSCRSTPMLSIR